jgi:glycerol-3-phosphate acyltransferase PlsY
MPDALTWLLCIAGAYLVGSIPFGLLIARAHGIDIRRHGSGNIGATNVKRVVGSKAGRVCFILDVGKGALPVLLAGVLNGLLNQPESTAMSATQLWWWLGVAVATVLGHMFSIYLTFTGGKGVATSFGALLAFWPMLTLPTVAALIVWYAAMKITRYVAVASMIAAIALPLGYCAWVFVMREVPGRALLSSASPPLWVTCVLALAVIWKHRSNIGRLRRGEEPRIGEPLPAQDQVPDADE